MTVKELKSLLAETPDETPVILAHRLEGNGASPVYQGDEMLYVPHDSWEGSVFGKREAETLGQTATPALVLRPVF